MAGPAASIQAATKTKGKSFMNILRYKHGSARAEKTPQVQPRNSSGTPSAPARHAGFDELLEQRPVALLRFDARRRAKERDRLSLRDPIGQPGDPRRLRNHLRKVAPAVFG